MDLVIKAYSALCELEVFTINGIKADYDDFGDKRDVSRYDAEEYGCGNMQFRPKPATQEILDRYGINITEYNEVCDKLDCLSFGSCGWCI